MAKVKQVHTCKACGVELFKKDQAVCHSCGFRLQASDDNMFSSPDYLYYQKQDFTRDTVNKIKKDEEVLGQFVKWVKTCPEEDLVAACHDAFYLLRYAALSGANADTIKDAVRIGKKIGSLANAIEQYVKNQGAINVSTIGETEPTDGLESEQPN